MTFPTDFDPSRCVLFLGSGFSAAAKSKNGKSPPVGNGLRDRIISAMGLPATDDDLKDVARYAMDRGLDLYGLLSELFIISDTNEDQDTILSKPWRRIYTTNYDDLVEAHDKKFRNSQPRRSYSISDSRPARLAPNSIIHLHGYIHACDQSNLTNELVLDHKSYAEQAALESPWWDQFNRDIEGSQWAIFVGYSLNDFAVAKYLTKRRSLVSKIRFVLRSPVSEIVQDRLSGYGTVFDVGASGFAEACRFATVGAPVSEFHELRSFELIDPFKDNRSVTRPTPVEIEAFLSRGRFTFQSLISTYPRPEFTIPRSEKVAEATRRLGEGRTLLVHAKTANGKSIFSNQLALSLSQGAFTCVRLKARTSISPQELAFLAKIQNLVIFIQNYDDAIEVAEDLKGLPEATKFVVEINTGTDQVRRSEVQNKLIGPIQRVDVNQLSTQDVADFASLLDKAGIPPRGIIPKVRSRIELRDLLINLVRSEFVMSRIEAAVRPIVDDRAAMKVVATACLLKSFGISAGNDFVRSVTKEDPIDVLIKNPVAFAEFGDSLSDEITFHSAVFCEHFLRKFVGSEGIGATICRLAIEAAKRKDDADSGQAQRAREARKALGLLLQFGNIEAIFKGTPDSESHITEIYEALRGKPKVNKEPLFWLQYSIFMQNIGNYQIARAHMETAYDRAKLISGFKTFQLDTNYLGLILQAPANEPNFPGDFVTLMDLLGKVKAMVTLPDHRLHALRVLEDLAPFAMNHGTSLDPADRSRLSLLCFGIASDLDGLALEVKTEFGSDVTKRAVKTAIETFARQPS